MTKSPFTPGFGLTPPVLAILGDPIGDFARALDGQGPAGERAVLISGPRGSGKTVLLDQLVNAGRHRGWEPFVLHTASTSMLIELRELVVHTLRTVDPDANTNRVTSVSGNVVGVGGGIGREVTDQYQDEGIPTIVLLERLIKLTAHRGGGLLLVVDEVQSADHVDLYEIGQYVQDLVRAGQPIALIAAGFTSGIQELLSNPRTTFLRRAHQLELGSVDIGTAAEVVAQTIATSDKTVSADAAVLAAEVSEGYPYLLQVVGDAAWRNAGDADRIDVEDVMNARPAAIDLMVGNVHGPALRDLTGRKLEYLFAMLEDDGPSATAEIADRIGVSFQNQNVLRSRLIADELIQPGNRGTVIYGLPYLREALERIRDGKISQRGVGRAVRPLPQTDT